MTQSDRLPGGIGVSRGRWVLARDGGLGALFFQLPMVLFFAVIVGIALLERDPGVLVVMIAPLAITGVASWLRRPGAAVTAEHQPDLHALVTDAARRIGAAPPDRIWLVGEPVVVAAVRHRRRELHIGLPLLACLSRAELAALVGHQLSLLRHRRAGLVTRLWHRWYEATKVAALYTDGEETPPRWVRSVRTALESFATEVAQHADGAAISAAGTPEAAARAFALAQTVDREYDGYLETAGKPPRRWWRLYETGISDLDDGWRRVVARVVDDTDWDADEATAVALRHPRMAGALRTLGAAPLTLHEPEQPVTVAPLSEREQRRLIRRQLDLPALAYVRWRTFESTPESWWLHRARQDAESVREDVAALLGREPVDDLETIRVVETRTREVIAASLEVPVEELSDDGGKDGDGPQPATIQLVEYALLQQGWRLLHPAVRGVLVGPDGETIDAAKLITDALAADAAEAADGSEAARGRTELHRLLSAPS